MAQPHASDAPAATTTTSTSAPVLATVSAAYILDNVSALSSASPVAQFPPSAMPMARVSFPLGCPNSISRIVTPLIADVWEEELRRAGVLSQFLSIPVGIRDGFDVGLARDATLARFSATKKYQLYENHGPALRNPEVIEKMIAEETAEGRISNFYAPEELYALVGPFRNAPLTIAPKDDSYAAGRVCQDYSHPREDPHDRSFNDSISHEDFVCDWGTFSQCYLMAARAPPHAQVAVFDVKAAHRRVPVLPWQQCFYVIA